jgi:hypothetical protein
MSNRKTKKCVFGNNGKRVLFLKLDRLFMSLAFERADLVFADDLVFSV